MICLGLALSTVGLDLISGQPRLIFGDMPGFYSGISFLVLAIGTQDWVKSFIPSKHSNCTHSYKCTHHICGIGRGLKRMNSLWKTMSLGSFLGFFVGMLPAAGATLRRRCPMGLQNRHQKHQHIRQGQHRRRCRPRNGKQRGLNRVIADVDTWHSRSPTTALLLGGMVMGLVPGPMLFIEQPDFVWGLISSLYTANFAAVAVNIALIPVFVWALRMPFTVLCAPVVVLCIGWVCTIAKDARCVVDLCLWRGRVLLRKADYPLALGSCACLWAIDGKFPSNPDCGTGQYLPL